MRELKKEELKAVSGGTLWLLGGLLSCLFPVKTYCAPVQTTTCAPSKPVQQPTC